MISDTQVGNDGAQQSICDKHLEMLKTKCQVPFGSYEMLRASYN